MKNIEKRYRHRDVSYLKQLEHKLERIERNGLRKLIEDMDNDIVQLSSYLPTLDIACEMIRKGFSPIYEADYGNNKIDLKIEKDDIPIFVEIKRVDISKQMEKRQRFEEQLRRQTEKMKYSYGYSLEYYDNFDWDTVNINTLAVGVKNFIRGILSCGIQVSRKYDYSVEEQPQIGIEFVPHRQDHLLFLSSESPIEEVTDYLLKKSREKLREIKRKFAKRINDSVLIGVIDVGHEFIGPDEFISLLYATGQIPASFDKQVNADDAIWAGKFRHQQGLDAIIMINEYSGKFIPYLFLNCLQNRYHSLIKSMFSSRYSRILTSEKQRRKKERRLIPRRHRTTSTARIDNENKYYRGCIIQPVVHLIQGGKWKAQAVITQEQGICVISRSLYFKETFLSKEIAQSKSINGARSWIDKKLAELKG